jgi:hypothetical protein
MLAPAAYGLVSGVPEPRVHDEFSYLLSADTFAHGRLTNPAPTMPEFFEAPHILVAPTYSSKYPPGQGLALAFGQLVGGHPIWGVWLSCGLFAASLCWMLQAWTSRPWALAVTVTAILTLGVSTYWAQSYWGGMLAASGGALLFGGMRRTWRAPHLVPSLLMGLGVVLLAMTRPYEGLLVCICAAPVIGWWLIASRRVPLETKLVRWMVPFVSVQLVGGAALAAHNRAVTGAWWQLPYQVHQNQYFRQGPFIFSPLREPERRPVTRLATFYARLQNTPRHGAELVKTAAASLLVRLPRTTLGLGRLGSRTAGGPVFHVAFWILAVSLVLISMSDPWLRFCLITILLVVLGQSFVWWWYPHYGAPLVSLVLAAVGISIRRVVTGLKHLVRLGRIAPALVVLLIALFVSPPLPAAQYGNGEVAAPASSDLLVTSRADAIERLEHLGGRHLVFVRYDESFPFSREWIWNAADPDGARVIFARDLGQKNRQLIAVYLDRSVWSIKVSRHPAQLMKESSTDSSGSDAEESGHPGNH